MTRCGVCASETVALPVGKATVGGHKCKSAEDSLAQERLPLTLLYCPNCSMTRYIFVPEADRVLDIIYSEQHATYSQSHSVSDYARSFAKGIENDISRSGVVLEIGCNDGSLLKEFQVQHGREVLGIEPGKTFSAMWEQSGVPVINAYFDKGIADQIGDRKFAAIIIRHVLEHIPDPMAFMQQVARLVDDETQVVIESPYLPTVIKDGRFENINYSHLNHFTLKSLAALTAPHGLSIVSSSLVDTDGGSFVARLRKGGETDPALLDNVALADLQGFLERMHRNGERLRQELGAYDPEEVVGYGAGAKGPHLISLYDLAHLISCVVDDNPGCLGQYIAGTALRIEGRAHLKKPGLKAVLNLAPTHRAQIRKHIPDHLHVIEVI